MFTSICKASVFDSLSFYLPPHECIGGGGGRYRGRIPKQIALFLIGLMILVFPSHADETKRIAILMANTGRQEPVNGFTEAISGFVAQSGFTFVYEIKNANNDKGKLPNLAAQMVAKRPDLLVAAGGIEADALKNAAGHTAIPTLFLSVSSVVERGLTTDMASPDQNITGIETNDTSLTEKRLWFIKKIFPFVKTVLCFRMSDIVPSVESVKVAQKAVENLGLTLRVHDVHSVAGIKKVMDTLLPPYPDVILLNPVAPVTGAIKEMILPRAMELKIPILGCDMASLKNGAFAYYAGSRYRNGRQAARLAIKLLQGVKPQDIPIETPRTYELVINKWMVARMELALPARVWRMADRVVDIKVSQ